MSNICTQIYLPVGTMLVTFNSAGTSALKGIWEQVTAGYALMSAALTATAMTTGGSSTANTTPSASAASHALTTTEIPSHSCVVNSWSGVYGSGGHSHGFTGAYWEYYRATMGGAARTEYCNVSGSNWWTDYSGGHSHGQGGENTAYQGSGSGHSHTVIFNTSTIDIHQRMIYVYIFRRTA